MINDKFLSAEKDHAEFSASGSERWLNCPGSIALSKKAPPQPESKYAKEGTEAHACLEFLVNNRKQLKKAIAIAEKKYNRDMIEHAVFAVKYVETRLKEFPGAKLLSETEIDSSHFTCPDQFGTLDLAIVSSPDRLIVIDYKYGAGKPVDAEENTQMIYYALGLLKKYDYDFDTVELVIIQPRAEHHSGEVVRSWTVRTVELIEWEGVFKLGVKKARTPYAPLKAGDWCKYCQAGPICPEISNKQFREAQAVFSENKELKVPDPASIAIPNIGKVLTACERLETWIEKVRDHAFDVLNRGNEIEGWKLVHKRSTRKWIDPVKASALAKKKFGDKAFSMPEILSPAQLEKAVNPEPLWLANLVSNESSGLTLVPESDKRQAVNPVALAFKEGVEDEVKKTASKPVSNSLNKQKRKK